MTWNIQPECFLSKALALVTVESRYIAIFEGIFRTRQKFSTYFGNCLLFFKW